MSVIDYPELESGSEESYTDEFDGLYNLRRNHARHLSNIWNTSIILYIFMAFFGCLFMYIFYGTGRIQTTAKTVSNAGIAAKIPVLISLLLGISPVE